MFQLKQQSVALAALLAGGLLLGACGSSGTPTSTPTSTLGTDSAATKVGGMPADTARIDNTATAPTDNRSPSAGQ